MNFLNYFVNHSESWQRRWTPLLVCKCQVILVFNLTLGFVGTASHWCVRKPLPYLMKATPPRWVCQAIPHTESCSSLKGNSVIRGWFEGYLLGCTCLWNTTIGSTEGKSQEQLPGRSLLQERGTSKFISFAVLVTAPLGRKLLAELVFVCRHDQKLQLCPDNFFGCNQRNLQHQWLDRISPCKMTASAKHYRQDSIMREEGKCFSRSPASILAQEQLLAIRQPGDGYSTVQQEGSRCTPAKKTFMKVGNCTWREVQNIHTSSTLYTSVLKKKLYGCTCGRKKK